MNARRAHRSFNLIHGRDSRESAATEIALYFTERELVNYQPAGSNWVFPANDA